MKCIEVAWWAGQLRLLLHLLLFSSYVTVVAALPEKPKVNLRSAVSRFERFIAKKSILETWLIGLLLERSGDIHKNPGPKVMFF